GSVAHTAHAAGSQQITLGWGAWVSPALHQPVKTTTGSRTIACPVRGTITMIIPHEMLSAEALQGIIEALVTREGTDYGTQDVSLATKVWQVRQQLDAGTAVLVYDEDTESCTIQPANQLSDHL